MEYRPKPKYSMRVCKEKIDNHMKYISKYKDGGVGFEVGVRELFGNIPNRMKAIVGGRGGVYSEWIYVGDKLWCIKNRSKYEFGRLMAVYIENDDVIIDGPWDNSKHCFMSSPEVVFDKDGVVGHVIGYNEFEVIISWSVGGKFGVGRPYSNIDKFTFKYMEDFKKYSKIFKK